jgi:hypothetical protein
VGTVVVNIVERPALPEVYEVRYHAHARKRQHKTEVSDKQSLATAIAESSSVNGYKAFG